ncbi:MAG: hypothetical protein R3B13_17855 [Polyangiaceae bacterium]
MSMDRRTALWTLGAGGLTLLGARPSSAAPSSAGETYSLSVGGKSLGLVNTFKPSSNRLGPFKATVNISQAGELLEWIESIWKKTTPKVSFAIDVGDSSGKLKRRLTMQGCIVKQVSLPKLAAKDGKKHFDIAVEWEVEDLKFEKGDGKAASAPKPSFADWLTSNFTTNIPGISSSDVLSVQLPTLARHPTRHYTGYTVSGLKTEHTPAGFEAALAMAKKVLKDGAISDSEYADWGVDIKDQTTKKKLGSASFARARPVKFKPASKGGKDGSTHAFVEWVVEEFDFKILKKPQ